MTEIEVKVIDVDVEKIKQKLMNLNAKLVKMEEQENYFFDLPTGNKEGYIRIRKTTSLIDLSQNIQITIKKIISKDEVRSTVETNLEINSIEDGIKFLTELGLKQTKKAFKYRESYLLQNALIEFDTWNKEEYPHPYIEIEGEKESIIKLIKLLEISPLNVTSKSLDEIKKEKGFTAIT
ncbi:CYTH domain protein [Caloramator mitchellensis]|uniref:CYTH domain protein n=1 Tax=Caloramator mitchellensis TaxID=908809 RepID=A0A0R3K4D9_CALMK|nr:CYTH domain-containing protein [Caloramator mitchellensis]KRQ87973.1 CYTH domain protein [Caloramator mitchellensis]